MVDALGTGATRALELDVPCPPLGQLLLDRGFISEKQLGSALEEQERSGLPLGQVIIGLGYVTASTIAQALGKQSNPPSAVGPAPTASAPDATLETARTRIAELEMELAATASANTGRIAELERQLSDARMDLGRIPALEVHLAAARQAEAQRDALARELELTRGQLAAVAERLMAACEQLRRYEAAAQASPHA
jgi:hypothetical protein